VNAQRECVELKHEMFAPREDVLHLLTLKPVDAYPAVSADACDLFPNKRSQLLGSEMDGWTFHGVFDIAYLVPEVRHPHIVSRDHVYIGTAGWNIPRLPERGRNQHVVQQTACTGDLRALGGVGACRFSVHREDTEGDFARAIARARARAADTISR
jgi:hypothetical protein